MESESRMTSTPTVAEKPTGVATTTIAERPGWDLSGSWMLLGGVLLFLAGIALSVVGGVLGLFALIPVGVVLFIASLPLLMGLTLVQPNQARVLQLLGSSYSGTLRTPGLRWTNPLTVRRSISTRIRNHETGQAKVNDADGNPIEISAVVVWQVADTALASFQVDDYEEFVSVQTEAAVRHIAGSYPYDAEGRVSLRENADIITTTLSEEVHARVRAAGVEVIETRINRLSYAPEIASAMLRRQQAGAVIAARKQIVEGAVSMVDMALKQLEEKHVVELDFANSPFGLSISTPPASAAADCSGNPPFPAKMSRLASCSTRLCLKTQWPHDDRETVRMLEAAARAGFINPSSRRANADGPFPGRLRWAGKGMSASLPLLAVVFKYCFVASPRIHALSSPS